MSDLIEKLRCRLLIEKGKKDRSGIYAVNQRLLAYNSNKIEGSKLNEKQTASLFETGTILSDGEIIKAKDVEEMTGHFMMFNEMLNTYNVELNQDLIKLYHFRLKSGVFEDLANGYPVGEYKNRKNIVSDIETTAPAFVERDMNMLLGWYNDKNTLNLEVLAKLHSQFEKIHPFQDGNGRVGRIILFKECLKNNIIPFIIRDENKAEYYNALNISQTKDDYGKLIGYFKKEQAFFKDLVNEFLIEQKSLRKEMIDNSKLIDKSKSINKNDLNIEF